MSAEANPIQSLIARRGGMRFRDFMELALYHPEHGYYGAGRAQLGRGGDFFTNVSVGPVYGRLLAVQFEEMWQHLGRPSPFTIVEQGANDGTLAADVLHVCRAQMPDFFAAMRYELIEGQDVLKARQQEQLGEFTNKAHWRASLDQLPPFTGVHFSNELADAFPVHLVRYRNGDWRELYVTADLGWRECPVDDGKLRAALADVPPIEGYTTEVNLEALRWAESLSAKLDRGWILTVDYGFPHWLYYSPERKHGTLECYASHKKGLDPLADPGHCDLTAHVDFTSLARAFENAGTQVVGFTDQHHFLTGLVSRAFEALPPTAQETRGLKTLLHPEMLGTSFKFLCVKRGTRESSLAGFKYARGARSELGL